MLYDEAYNYFFPNPAPYKRHQGDSSYYMAKKKELLTPFSATPAPKPSLVSSYHGTIDTLLFSFPSWAVARDAYASGYKSLIKSLRKGTKFVVVHQQQDRVVVERWFSDAGHVAKHITFVPIADDIDFTDWAEDPYVALIDPAGGQVLLEPWHFFRGGDALIADAVERHTKITSTQSPLIFQGGNCLIGDNYWLLGRDYLTETVDLLLSSRSPLNTTGMNREEVELLSLRTFSEWLDSGRALKIIGTEKAIPLEAFVAQREGDNFYLDYMLDGVGIHQPVFHIDMFITLVGRNSSGKFTILVGSPSLGATLSGEKSPQPMDQAYNEIAAQFPASEFDVHRTPIIHKPLKLGETYTFADLATLSQEDRWKSFRKPVAQFRALGAADDTKVQGREFGCVTWNNCLVENSSKGKHVYLPTFGHGNNGHLKAVDEFMRLLWKDKLHFDVKMLGDFTPFAARSGVVHCIKKYLARSRT